MISDGVFDRGIEGFKFLVKNELIIIFTQEAVPKLKELIIESFRENLLGVVKGEYASLKPEDYEGAFVQRIEEYEYVRDGGEGVVLSCPDSETFDFSEGLGLIGGIVNGLPADYYKVKGSDYQKFAGEEAQGAYGLQDYLIEDGNPFLENFDKNSLDKFEFSSTPPVDIMLEANEYVKGNMPTWIRRAVEKARMNLEDFLSGANRG